MRSLIARSVLPLVLCAGAGHAQCTLLVIEDFGLGPRPAGGNGQLRDALIHDNLNGFWARFPVGARWRSPDGAGGNNWIFAATSDDHTEPRQNDQWNGTAFSSGNAAALLPFAPPVDAYTFSASAVMPLGYPAGSYLGFTSTGTLNSNFLNDGTLYVKVTGEGDWTLYANGSQVVASGVCGLGKPWDGWTEVRFTYDPAAHSVSGKVGDTMFGPLALVLTRPVSFVGMENIDLGNGMWSVVNKLVVSQGSGPNASASTDHPGVCTGENVVVSVASDATGDTRYDWMHDGVPLDDGEVAGATISGAHGPAMSLSGVTPAMSGQYACLVSTFCGWTVSLPVAVTVGGTGCTASCNDTDFNNDGLFPDTADIDDFLSVFSGGPCPTGGCDSIDFNNDGLFPDTTDIDSFLSVFSGGPCT